MTPAEHQAVMDIAEVQVNRYFDHYLTDVFPHQIAAIMDAHNQDAEAHDPRFGTHEQTCPTKRRVDRLKWMIAGGAAALGAIGGLVAEHLPKIIQALLS